MLTDGECRYCGRRDVINQRGRCLECMTPEELKDAKEEADQALLGAAILLCALIVVFKVVSMVWL